MASPKQTKLDDFDGCQTTLEEYIDDPDDFDCSWEAVYKLNRVK